MLHYIKFEMGDKNTPIARDRGGKVIIPRRPWKPVPGESYFVSFDERDRYILAEPVSPDGNLMALYMLAYHEYVEAIERAKVEINLAKPYLFPPSEGTRKTIRRAAAQDWDGLHGDDSATYCTWEEDSYVLTAEGTEKWDRLVEQKKEIFDRSTKTAMERKEAKEKAYYELRKDLYAKNSFLYDFVRILERSIPKLPRIRWDKCLIGFDEVTVVRRKEKRPTV